MIDLEGVDSKREQVKKCESCSSKGRGQDGDPKCDMNGVKSTVLGGTGRQGKLEGLQCGQCFDKI